MPYLTLTLTENLKLQLSPGLVASYDIQPGNGVGLFWDKHTQQENMVDYSATNRECNIICEQIIQQFRGSDIGNLHNKHIIMNEHIYHHATVLIAAGGFVVGCGRNGQPVVVAQTSGVRSSM